MILLDRFLSPSTGGRRESSAIETLQVRLVSFN